MVLPPVRKCLQTSPWERPEPGSQGAVLRTGAREEAVAADQGPTAELGGLVGPLAEARLSTPTTWGALQGKAWLVLFFKELGREELPGRQPLSEYWLGFFTRSRESKLKAQERCLQAPSHQVYLLFS